mgnify:CR=1 FL=1
MKFLVFLLFVVSSFSENSNGIDHVVGIDLGTGYAGIGMMIDGNVEIVNFLDGPRIPACVAFRDGEELFGEEAKNQRCYNPENTISEVKRFMGRNFNDKTLQDDAKHIMYTITDYKNNPYIEFQVNSQRMKLKPQEICAKYLKYLKLQAEDFLGESLSYAVITVPTIFSEGQRRAVKEAGTLAGFEVLRIVNEQTAAAYAYKLDNVEDESYTIVIDVGITLDVVLYTVDQGIFEVIDTSGDAFLGAIRLIRE